jgi:serine protease Do
MKKSKISVPKSIQSGKILAVVLFLLLSIGGGFLGGYYGSKRNTSSTDLKAQKEVISSESNLISSIAKDVGPSVVSINVMGESTSAINPYYRGGSDTQESAGTGIIVSSDVIVTNRHVVPAGTTSVNVVLSDGTKLDKVTVIGRTNESDPLDVAFLKVNDTQGKKLQAATLGDSSKMQVGDKVVAIGNALGQFQNTVTSGIISGYGRDVQAGDSSGQGSVESLQDLFQTDAAINEGNSGGPLVNMNGEVIGINTAIAGGAQNIGFSIPIDDVSNMIKGVLQTGKLQRPYLGVRYISITDDYASANGLSVKRGAYIPSSAEGSVVAGSPAEMAGLKAGDIITKVNNTEVNEDNSLSAVLGRFAVGQKVTLTVIRDGKTQTIDVSLGQAPQS